MTAARYDGKRHEIIEVAAGGMVLGMAVELLESLVITVDTDYILCHTVK